MKKQIIIGIVLFLICAAQSATAQTVSGKVTDTDAHAIDGGRPQVDQFRLRVVAEPMEGFSQVRFHRGGGPEPLHRQLHAVGFIEGPENELALPPGVAGIDHKIIVAPADFAKDFLDGLSVAGQIFERVGNNGQVFHLPLLPPRVIVSRLRQRHQVPMESRKIQVEAKTCGRFRLISRLNRPHQGRFFGQN